MTSNDLEESIDKLLTRVCPSSMFVMVSNAIPTHVVMHKSEDSSYSFPVLAPEAFKDFLGRCAGKVEFSHASRLRSAWLDPDFDLLESAQ